MSVDRFVKVVVVGVGIGLGLAGCDKKGEADKPKADAPAGGASPAPAAPGAAAVPAEPIATTPTALGNEFSTNTAAARAKYPRLTPFKLTGVVAGFGIDTLKLKDEDKPELPAVACTFDKPADQARVKKASRGDKFTVVGKLNGYVDKTVELIGCTIVD